MTNIPYNYQKYIDDVTKMRQRGTISAGEQIASPSSAGSRGLAKTTQFTNNPTQMTLGESMEDIKSILNRIDGVNAPVQEKEFNPNDERDEAPREGDVVNHKDLGKVSVMKVTGSDQMGQPAEYIVQAKLSYDELMGDVELGKFESYEPFPEADEFDIEEDEDFEEVLGPLGFPEDETVLFDAEYRGRKVPLNKPMRGDVKKFKVYVKDPKTGNVKKVNFGHGGTSAKRKTMRIRKSNPKARKSFRARHNCANPGPKTKARYWSCRKW